MTTKTIAERVAAGAAWLDEDQPGWDQRIDLDKLSIGSGCNCILGQLHGGFGAGLEESGLLEVNVRDYSTPEEALGFVWNAYRSEGVTREIKALDAAWKRLIAARRAGDPR